MKLNVVKQIFEDAGYKYHSDKRNRTHRALTDLLESGIIKFKVCDNGHVWLPEGKQKYNLSISIKCPDGMFYNFKIYQKGGLDGYTVLKAIGKVLQNEKVKTEIKSYVDLDSSCQKCNGVGFIPQFHYYCNGICFDCYGIGFNRKFKPTVKILTK